MKLLFLGKEHLQEVLDPLELADVIKEAYIDYSKRLVANPPRTTVFLDNDWWGIMPALARGRGVSVKAVSIIPGNNARGLPTVNALVVLLDDKTGLPLAVIDGTILTAYRTAAGVLAVTKTLRGKVSCVGLIGTGFQGRHLALFHAEKYTGAKRIVLYDRDKHKAESLAKHLKSMKLYDEILVADNPGEACRCDVLLLATTSSKPVIDCRWLGRDTLVISIGVTGPQGSELDPCTVKKAVLVAVDSKEQCVEEVNDIRGALPREEINEKVSEIGEVLGRAGDYKDLHGVVVFKSCGLAVQDLYAARYFYDKAMSRGIGLTIDM